MLKLKKRVLTDTSTTADDLGRLEDLNEEETTENDFKHYIKEMQKQGHEIDKNIKNIIEIKNRCKKENLIFFRSLSLNGLEIPIYKTIKGTEPDKKIFYISFNGLYAIKWRDLRKFRKNALYIEEYIEEYYNINFF